MNQNRKNSNDKSLRIGDGSENPIAEKAEAYSAALEALPKQLQSPIAEYVKQHVEMELTPAPVTKADYLAHFYICLASFLLILGVWEINRFGSINRDTVYDSLAYTGVTFAIIWFIALFLSVILRIQTRKFQISSALVATTLAFLSFWAVNWVSVIILFFINPRWLAISLSQSILLAGILFWVHWFARNALPSSRAKMVRVVSVSLVFLIVGGLFAKSYNRWDWNDEDLVPRVQVIPYASGVGAIIDMENLVRENFADAARGAEVYADVHSSRGRNFYLDKNYSRSIESYSKAISLDQKNASSFSERADSYIQIGEYDLALSDLQEAARLDKKAKYLAVTRGHVFYLKGDLARAISEYDSYLSRNSEEVGARLGRGVAFYYSGDLEHALADFSEALREKPKYFEALLWKEITEKKLGLANRNQKYAKKFTVRGEWPAPLVNLFFGDSNPIRALASAKDDHEKYASSRICSTFFFSGQWALQKKRYADAKNYFELAEKECNRKNVLWQSSRSELAKISSPK